MANACLQRVKTRMELDLHPSKLSDVQAGVYDLLNEMLIRYDDALDGVVLAIGRPRILSHLADVHPYFPLCRVHLAVPLTLFTPKEGDMLDGKVIEVGPDFIGLLVLGVINASIAKSAMRQDWTWDAAAKEWKSSKHEEHKIAVQSFIRFTVKSIQKNEVFFGIDGQMTSKKTGAIDYLLKHKDGQPANGVGPSSTKAGKEDSSRKRKKEGEQTDLQTNKSDKSNTSCKKEKKRKKQEASTEEQQDKQKKKKHKAKE